MTDRGNSVVMN